MLAVLAYRTKQDIREYDRFKKLKSSKARQASYKKWIGESFLMFAVTSILALLLTGHLSILSKPLSELTQALPYRAKIHISFGSDQIGFLVGVATSALFSVAILRALTRKGTKKKDIITIGDINALLPRNNAERAWGLALSLNAGLSEELFFRLLLPILFFIVFGNAILALVLSCIIFGLVHIYQGWIGIIFTGLLGAGLMYIYLITGHIWIAMLVHAAIDINGLIIQPFMQHNLFKSK